MYVQLQYSLQVSQWNRSPNAPETKVTFHTFQTIRNIRSATSRFWTLDRLLHKPKRLIQESKTGRPLMVPGCLPSEEFRYSHFANGLKRRVGDQSKPSMSLQDRQVRWIDGSMPRWT
jgi:hypothetical protein